jgi:hypothetical protein
MKREQKMQQGKEDRTSNDKLMVRAIHDISRYTMVLDLPQHTTTDLACIKI